MTAKEDVLLPQDAQAVDPSKLSALTPEVVSFVCAREAHTKSSQGRRAAMGYGLSRLEGRIGARWDDVVVDTSKWTTTERLERV